jgi:DegV family protein with EDD domain
VTERVPAGWVWVKERLARLRQQTTLRQQTAQGRAGAAGPAVVRVAVVTDSAAALPVDWVKSLAADGRLSVVPMPVMLGEEIYGEGEDDIAERLAIALASGIPVKTSRPSPGQFEQAYLGVQERGFEAIVSIHISGELSGTADAARLAAGRVGIPVEVLDSRTVGMAQGMGVQSALTAAAEGRGASEVRSFAEDQLKQTRVYFYVPSLEQLRRGGRIGTAASLLGTVLAIKPILAVDDGRIVPLEKVRSGPRAIARLEEIVAADVGSRAAGQARLAVHHFGNLAAAEELAARLAESCPGCPAPQISALPAVLAAHAGLGVLAVIVGGSSAFGN